MAMVMLQAQVRIHTLVVTLHKPEDLGEEEFLAIAGNEAYPVFGKEASSSPWWACR